MLACADEGSGPPIVFVHGLGSDHTRWASSVDLLVDEFRCVSVDLPGHGRSPDEGTDALSAASALHELVAHLDLGAPVIVGHSLGSTVALLYAALYGARSIVAVDPIHLYLPHLSDAVAAYRERLLGDDFDAAFDEWEAGLGRELVPEPRRSALAAGPRPRPDTVRSYWRLVLDRDAAVEAQPRLTGALTSITAPALIWLADPPTPEDAAILEQMPTATVEVSPGMGHYLHLVDPEGFVARLRTWIAALPG